MATLYAYPLATPKNADLMVGTSIPLPNTNKDEQARTVNFSVSSIVALISTATGAQTFQQVTNIGQVDIGGDSVSTTTNNIKIGGIFFDSASAKGTDGQILTSNAAGKLIWSTSGSLTGVTATLPMLSSGGTAPVISINTMGVANASTAGLKGAVPASLAGDQLKFLRADATWQVPLTGVSSVAAYNTTAEIDRKYAGLHPVTPAVGAVKVGLAVTQMTSIAEAVADEDLMIVTDDPSGIPYNKKITVGNLKTHINTDTLQSVTARGAASDKAITLSNNLLINGTGVGSVTLAGTGVGGYLYVTGNAGLGGVTIPSHSQGIALAYNNSEGQRESELFWNTGAESNTPAINNVSFFGIYNEFIDSTSGNARVTTNQVKLYGTGNFELTRPNASLMTPNFSSPIVDGTINSLLVRSNTRQTAFTTTLSYNESNATLAILPASGTPSQIQMKSADNSIWKLTISNAGALVITAA